jgi:ABC-type molybdenum transport system ATPase subunit/photorepair protein PhrA
MEVPARYQWTAMTANNETFRDNGFGPFVVQHKEIRDKIIQGANPNVSYHISECRGAGKTTLLHLIANDLTAAGKKKFFSLKRHLS